MTRGSVTLSGPGESMRLPLKYYNGDEGTALDIARSKAISRACAAKHAVTWYVRDESEAVYCHVERDDYGHVRVVMR